MQANIFASRFLAPASVLHALHVHSAEEIAAICGLSRQAAQIRLERLRELEKRNKWILSPLEQQVIQQFTPFIERKSQMIPK